MDIYPEVSALMDDDDAMLRKLECMSTRDVFRLVKYLVSAKQARARAVRSYSEKKALEYGVSAQWQHIMTNPEAYQKKLRYNREYNRRKREENRKLAEKSEATRETNT